MNYRREQNYYAVTCKCGHTGSERLIYQLSSESLLLTERKLL